MDKLFPGGGAALRSSLLSQIDRPRRTARPIVSGATNVVWADDADDWTATGTWDGSATVDKYGARLGLSATSSEDNVAIVYSTRTLPARTDKGDGRRGHGARFTAVFSPVAGIKELVVAIRAAVAGTPSGGEEYDSWGISRLSGETSFYAYMRAASPAVSVRRALGAYTVGHVYMAVIEVVGGSQEIRLYDLTDRKWLGPTVRLSDTLPTGQTRLMISASTASGGTAAKVAIGDIDVYPAFVTR